MASILEQLGLRRPKKREGRSPDEQALRNSFETFFSGAQWTADGKRVDIELDGEKYHFNLELMVDVHSAAQLGIAVRDEEDAISVVDAHNEAVKTVGRRPIAVLLDNKACNEATKVAQAIKPAHLIFATKGRGQNKAHVEGSFGLFSQQMPRLALTTNSRHELARQIVELVARTFHGALNMRPRKTRGNRSRIELYTQDTPKPEQVAQAQASLRARLARQNKAKETQRHRSDPMSRAYINDAFERLGLDDPTKSVRNAIARYPLCDVAEGVAIFAAKQNKGTLPEPLVEAPRYLLGIVRNRHQEREGMAIAVELWAERIRARDFVLEPLVTRRDELTNTCGDTHPRLKAFVDEALTTDSGIERYFWLTSTVELIVAASEPVRRSLYDVVARRIQTTYRVPYRERLESIQLVARELLPLH